MTINWKKTKRIALHLCFWISFYFFYASLYGYISGNFKNVLLQSLFTLPIDICITYFTIYFLIPRYLLKKKYFYYILFLIFSCLFAGAAERLLNHFYVYPLFYPKYIPAEIPIFTLRFFNITVSIFLVVILANAIKILKFWLNEKHHRMELEIQNQSSELALLRNQINPHFLFNTLNNIHTLITKDSDKAADALMRLSEIMRYMLYETTVELVPIEKEIEYIQSYIELQKLRLTNPQYIHCKLDDNLKGFLIAPMLFIPFIENTFKHSDKNNKNEPISISLRTDGQGIFFSSSNPIRSKHEESLDKVGGIGLKNVKRRLELLYPNNYSLEIAEKNSTFTVQLTINLYDN